jgi:hypothetical protein
MATTTIQLATGSRALSVGILVADLCSVGEVGKRHPPRTIGGHTVSVDVALTERARRGDPESFRILVERHGDAAYFLALRVVRSPQDAEEVAQDAFFGYGGRCRRFEAIRLRRFFKS